MLLVFYNSKNFNCIRALSFYNSKNLNCIGALSLLRLEEGSIGEVFLIALKRSL